MKKLIIAVLAGIAVLSHSASAEIIGFNGDYDVSKWTYNAHSLKLGGADVSGAPDSIKLSSVDDDSGLEKYQDFTITAPVTTTISFDWDYISIDEDASASFDPFGWVLDGAFTQLTDDAGGISQSGSASFKVNVGQTFGFRALATDSRLGEATTVISNFHAVPEPAVLSMIGIFGGGAVIIRRWFMI